MNSTGIFTAADGFNITTSLWYNYSVPLLAVVLAFHGLGEHSYPWNWVFTQFSNNGFAVKAMDMRGHGRTHEANHPKRDKLGHTPFKLVFQDMLNVYHQPIAGKNVEHVPTFVFGHSLGGLLSLAFTDEYRSEIINYRGTISQCPAISPSKPVPLHLRLLAEIFGDTILGNVQRDRPLMDISDLVTDPAVVARYEADRFRHNKITIKTAKDIFSYGHQMMNSKFNHTLLMAHSPDDKVTSAIVSRRFFDGAVSSDKQYFIFPGSPHVHTF